MIVYSNLGLYSRAEPLLAGAIASSRDASGAGARDTIASRVLGAEHPTTVASMYNLGVLLHETGRYEEAEKVHREALAIERVVLGPNHPNVGASLYNLACIQAKLGWIDAAFEELRRAAESSYANADWMLEDEDLAALHGDPRFDEIVTAVRRNEQTR